MSLNKAAFAQALMDSNEGADNPADAGSGLGQAIGDYIKDNATINYAWVATNPSSGAPDPVTAIQPKAASPIAPWTMPSGATDASAAMGLLATAINTFVSTMMLSADGFTLTPMNIISACVLSPSGASDRQEAMEALAQSIIDGLSVTPAATGSHAAFVGAASGGSIS
jgi:hypothetical protein